MPAFCLAAASLLCLAFAFILAVGMVSFTAANYLLAAATCLGMAAILMAVMALCSTGRQPWWNLTALVAAFPSLLFMPNLCIRVLELMGGR